MRDAFICDAVRTPIGRYGGALAKVRTDDLAAVPIRELIRRNSKADWSKLDEVFYGCANQAGEDNRNVARMALLLAGLPDSVGGVTLNRLCASGLEAVASAARAVRAGDIDLAIAGGVESMTRAPFVMGKAQEEFQVTRADQDAFALRSQQRAGKAIASGYFAEEIVPVEAPGGRSGPIVVDKDEHPRPDTTLEGLAKLKTPFRNPGTVTAGNASGVNDGAAAMIVASEAAVKRHGLKPRARVLGAASAGVPPHIMGIGPVPASRKLMDRLKIKIGDFDVIELNEAFAAQSLAVLRQLGLADDAEQVNPNGGAIALGHPLGMSGARLALTVTHQLEKTGGRLGLATLCVGFGQGASMAPERVA